MKGEKKAKAKVGNDLYLGMVVDRSGSMSNCRDATISAFNEYLNDRKKETGKTLVWITLFNAPSNREVDMLCDGTLADGVPVLDHRNYVPDGMTALYDAIGMTIRHMQARIAADKYAGKVLFVIQTDGAENSSREWSRDAIFKLREEMEALGNWTFVFLGADIDAYGASSMIGVAAANTVSYAKGATGQSMGSMSMDTRSYRSSAGLQSNNLVSDATRIVSGVAQPMVNPEPEPDKKVKKGAVAQEP